LAQRNAETKEKVFATEIQSERVRAQEAIDFVRNKLKAQIRELEISLEGNRADTGDFRTEKRKLERELSKVRYFFRSKINECLPSFVLSLQLKERYEEEQRERAGIHRQIDSLKRQVEQFKDRVAKVRHFDFTTTTTTTTTGVAELIPSC